MLKTYQIPQLSQAKPKNVQLSIDLFESKATDSDHVLMKELLALKVKYPRINPSQDRLASLTGYCRKTVSRRIARLKEMGWLSTKWTPYKALEYILHPMFDDPKVLSEWRVYFCIFIPIIVLLSCPRGGVPLLERKELYLSKNLKKSSSIICKESMDEKLLYNPLSLRDRSPMGFLTYGIEIGESNPKRSMEEFEAILENKVGNMSTPLERLKEKLFLNPANLEEIEGYSNQVLVEAERILNKIPYNGNPTGYFLKTARILAEKEQRNLSKRVQEKSGATRERHSLTPEKEQQRANERREEWESRHGEKQHDYFYAPRKESKSIDQPDKWWTSNWCKQRLDEDMKSLYLASKADQSNDYMRYSIPIIKQRISKCQAILEQPSRTTNIEIKEPAISARSPMQKHEELQPSLFQDDEPEKLSYDLLDEILD